MNTLLYFVPTGLKKKGLFLISTDIGFLTEPCIRKEILVKRR